MGNKCEQSILELAGTSPGMALKRIDRIMDEVLGRSVPGSPWVLVEEKGLVYRYGLELPVYSIYEHETLREILSSHLEMVVRETREGAWARECSRWEPSIEWERHDSAFSVAPDHATLRVKWTPHPKRPGKYLDMDVYRVYVVETGDEAFENITSMVDPPSHRRVRPCILHCSSALLSPVDRVIDDGVKQHTWIHTDHAEGPFVPTENSRVGVWLYSINDFSRIFDGLAPERVLLARDHRYMDVAVLFCYRGEEDSRSIAMEKFKPWIVK